MSTARMAAYNRSVYEGFWALREYRGAAALQRPEAAILSRISSEFSNKRILDLGVGGGRTTPHLLQISERYIGLDFSPAMIAGCRARYQSVIFEVGDARDLSRFETGSFDLVMFSFNGIDCIDHSGRLKALTEIHRVLTPSGAFIFSSHNRLFTNIPSAWSWRRLPWDVNPLSKPFHFARRLVYYPIGIWNHLFNLRHVEYHDEYAILNTVGNDYANLTYAISIDAQLKQLSRIGFKCVEVVGLDDAQVLDPDQFNGRRDAWIYYLCRA